MFLCMTKDVLTQDNEPFTFTTLGAATLNVVRWLENPKEHGPDRKRQAPENDNERDKARDHDKAVNEGMRQIERFESPYRRADRS
jgi:hypothetical protein